MIVSLFRAWDTKAVVTYTVHERGDPVADRIDRAEELVFIKDGFNFSAAFFAPFWLLLNALWFEFAGYVVAAIVIVAGFSWLGLGSVWPFIGLMLLHVLIGAEADSLKRYALERAGWKTAGTVVGRNMGECERRFFDTWLEEQPLLRRDGEMSVRGLAVGGPAVHASGGQVPVAQMRRRWPFGK